MGVGTSSTECILVLVSRSNMYFNQGLKYRFLRIYRYFDFTDISEISEKYRRNIVDIFSQMSIK